MSSFYVEASWAGFAAVSPVLLFAAAHPNAKLMAGESPSL